MQNQIIKTAQEVERHQREFIENLEKLSKGKLQDHGNWHIMLKHLPDANGSLLVRMHDYLEKIEIDCERSVEENRSVASLKASVEMWVDSIREICFQSDALMWFLGQELSIDDFLYLNALTYHYKQLKESGNTTITLTL